MNLKLLIIIKIILILKLINHIIILKIIILNQLRVNQRILIIRLKKMEIL